MPPVANRRMPGRRANSMVAATVVAAVSLGHGETQIAPAGLQGVALISERRRTGGFDFAMAVLEGRRTHYQ